MRIRALSGLGRRYVRVTNSVYVFFIAKRLSRNRCLHGITWRLRSGAASWSISRRIYADIVAGIVVWCCSGGQTSAATFLISMKVWDHIPSVEIVEAEDNDEGNLPGSCDRGKNVFGPAPMDKGFKQRYVSKVTSSSPLCWRRNADPQNEASKTTKWYICEATTNLTIIDCRIE
jgi:hypothetical protein